MAIQNWGGIVETQDKKRMEYDARNTVLDIVRRKFDSFEFLIFSLLFDGERQKSVSGICQRLTNDCKSSFR